METGIFNSKVQSRKGFCFLFLLLLSVSAASVFAQETPPAPGVPRSVSVPAVQEKKLANGLTVAVIEKKAVPLVTINLLIKSGASSEDANKAGLADITASMLTKGTKTKTATQIAEAVEFLGGSINSGANWNSSFVSITVTSDKVNQAMAILADVVLNPKFDQKELDLLKSQTLDGLTYNLKQPSYLANYVASKYSFDEHPTGGTPSSVANIGRSDVANFKKESYTPKESVLIFAGDITWIKANSLSSKFFGAWKNNLAPPEMTESLNVAAGVKNSDRPAVKRLLVVDLSKSGQAAVSYTKYLEQGRMVCFVSKVGAAKCRSGFSYFPALVMNSVLGGGYSSRLNQEIRIKRGLSYGAGSSIAWRYSSSNFATRAQTKNESAPEVVGLVIDELRKLGSDKIQEQELIPRKSVLTGNFGRTLETTGGLASALGDFYAFDLPTSGLTEYLSEVNAVTDSKIQDFVKQNILGGDIIIVGDYSIFKDDLAKRFPGMKIDVIKADELDLSKDNLRK